MVVRVPYSDDWSFLTNMTLDGDKLAAVSSDDDYSICCTKEGCYFRLECRSSMG